MFVLRLLNWSILNSLNARPAFYELYRQNADATSYGVYDTVSTPRVSCGFFVAHVSVFMPDIK